MALKRLKKEELSFLFGQSGKMLLLTTVVTALVYLLFLTFFMPKGNAALFYALIVGEVFHFWQIFSFVHTVWEQDFALPVSKSEFYPSVDVYITVAGEPADIVGLTALAAKQMQYPNFSVYLLNDGYVAKKDNWQEIEKLAKVLGINCITRTIPGGAKAGNINNALKSSTADLVAIFDADQVPHKDFLQKTVPYFSDPKMGFVQSPQYYKNHSINEVTAGSWEQQELFFGAVCKGKNRLNSTFMCGTNMVVNKTALLEVGGMCETNIAEDFLTSLFLHERHWKSLYVPEVLAEGLAPEDFLSYYKQQFRWARGSLEVIFKYNPLFRKGLSWQQKIQYLASASFYLSGLFVLVNCILPLIYFFTGYVPLTVSTMALTAIFLPYIFFAILSLQTASNHNFTFRAIAFSISSFSIHLQAIFAVLTNQKSSFSVTAKKQLSGNFMYLTWPHILYVLATLIGVAVSVTREGLSAAFLSNLSWAMFYSVIFCLFISASAPSLYRSSNENFKRIKRTIGAIPVAIK